MALMLPHGSRPYHSFKPADLVPCLRCQRLWQYFDECVPSIPNCADCAAALSLQSRHQLSRWLGKHGLPSFRTLADCARLVAAVERWQHDGIPLVRQAWDHGLEPTVCYRTVQRAAGMGWQGVRSSDPEVWLTRWAEMRSRAACIRGTTKVRQPSMTNQTSTMR